MQIGSMLSGSSPDLRAQPWRVREYLWFALFLVSFAFAYDYGTAFSHATPSPFWVPDSILLCALLKAKPRDWWIFLLGILPIRLYFLTSLEFPVWLMFAGYTVDVAKALLTAIVLRRLLADPLHFQNVREFLVFVSVAALLVPALSAFAGAGMRQALGDPFWPAWERWFLGDALAQLVVTPAIFYWVFDPPWRKWRPSPAQLLEACTAGLCLLLVGYLAAHTKPGDAYMETRFYAPVPILLWAAIRFGMTGASGGIAVIAFFALEATLHGQGRFAGYSPRDTALALRDYLFLRAIPLFLVAISVDQRQRIERSLRASEERFRRMAQSAPVLLWMSGRDKLCTFFNRGWLEFTGRSLEQELGNGWTDGVHPLDLKHCVEHYEASFDGRRPFEMEYRLRRHDGEYRWIVDIGVPLYDADGEFSGYIGSAIDITDRKRAEETSRALAYTQRLAVMGELMAAIAHEVRQPISAISLDAQVVEKMTERPDAPLDELHDIAASIRKNVARVDAVISRIRGYLRKQDQKMRAFDINAVVLDVLWIVTGDARRRNVQLRTDLDQSLPLVMADRTQLEQVLLNLVVNGMDAMDGVADTSRHLTLSTRRAGDGGVEVTVRDCGTGIDPEQMPQLFDSFFTTRREGMGLGLSIAKSIVDAYRGRIWAENNATGGATFHFTVPAAEEELRQAS